MLHSGDIYEVRARAARNRELKQLTRALSGFLLRTAHPKQRHAAPTLRETCANDRTAIADRAA